MVGVFSVVTISHIGTAQASHTLLIWALIIGLVSAGEFGSTSVWSTAKKNGAAFSYTDAILAKLLIFLCLGGGVVSFYIWMFGGGLAWLLFGLVGAAIQILFPTWYFSLTGKPEKSTAYIAAPRITQALLITLFPVDPNALIWGWVLGCLPLLYPVFTTWKMQSTFKTSNAIRLVKLALPMAFSVSSLAYAPKIPLVLASKIKPELIPILSVGESIYQLLKSLTAPISQTLFSSNNKTKPTAEFNRINKVAFWIGVFVSVLTGMILLSTPLWATALTSLFKHVHITPYMQVWLKNMSIFPLLTWLHFYYGVNGLIAAGLTKKFVLATLGGLTALCAYMVFFYQHPSLTGAISGLFLMDAFIFIGLYVANLNAQLLDKFLYLSAKSKLLNKASPEGENHA